MWFITDAWARSNGGHNGVQHSGSGDHFPTDSETGLALIAGAILIWIGWLVFEFVKLYRENRRQPMARAAGNPRAPSNQPDSRRLNDRVRSVKLEDE
jgi:hypothetical protein